MSAPDKKYPGSFGEWDIEIAAQSTADLLVYRTALQTIQTWEALKGAFAWTRIFLLIDSINYELAKRERKQ